MLALDLRRLSYQCLVHWYQFDGELFQEMKGFSGSSCSRFAYEALTCEPHASKLNHMSKMIQLRNVPDHLHRKLKARAATEGRSLSDYLLEEIRRAADRPTLAEMAERLQHREKTNPSPSPEEAVRAERDRH